MPATKQAPAPAARPDWPLLPDDGAVMSFVGGSASFRSHHRQQTTYPLGGGGTRVIDGVAVRVARPEVVFVNNLYATPNAQIAKGLITSNNFQGRHGWFLNQSSLPLQIRSAWPSLNRTAKKRVAIDLAHNRAVDDILDSLEETDRVRETPTKSATGVFEMPCPVHKCYAVMKTVGESAVKDNQEAMAEHIRVMHPQWDGK